VSSLYLVNNVKRVPLGGNFDLYGFVLGGASVDFDECFKRQIIDWLLFMMFVKTRIFVNLIKFFGIGPKPR